ncbi:helix-turn-helix domain-containing protein [Rubrobacter radiotolerans]|uniref:Helix-turn-helix domain-containing protein n=1 Tax=Rubrobacter radiotolerans TaxID=42256 RepID=A0AB35T6I6_RUBRA|nr:helix-turn-helix domain-containing protein [Rubrobacter radiotolerans]MDX5895304.1 helix-turn-helix domain-containing protein [Rubrobacter radiotolerans]SMC01609.1 Helix-turn-helix [Rubrobacter radiotolerans DSM 5868]
MRSVAKKFEMLLERYRHADGRKWNGQEIQSATGGVVTRSYVSMLRKGHISNPGYDKLRAIAKAMGFPPEVWFEDIEDADAPAPPPAGGEAESLAHRLERLFETFTDERTGESYSSADVARMSLGNLAEDEVEGIRTGQITNPTVNQILALSEVFGVDPSYFLNRNREPPLLDQEAIKALGDSRSRLLLHKSLGLSDGEKDMIIDMIEHLGYLNNPGKTTQ